MNLSGKLAFKITPALKAFLGPELRTLDASLQRLADETDGFLGDLMRYVLKGSGKRIRPALVFITSRLGSSKKEAVQTVALAIELIHIATLIHDDVIDKAALRRGVKTVVELEGADTAILLGDYIYTLAYKKVAALNEPVLLELLAEATHTICEGEINQLKRRFQFDLTEEEYFSFIRKKTAALFGASARCGALLAGQTRSIQKSLERFGVLIGEAFQLRDDVLDITALEEDMGKTLRTDILNGKMTLPMIYYRDGLKGMGLKSKLDQLRYPNGSLDSLIEGIKKAGAIDRVQGVLATRVRLSKNMLSNLPKGSVRSHLENIASIFHE